MIVCIAEKPSVARDIAKILGANTRHDGFLEGNGYRVTWTFGHLCTLKEPHDYAPFLKYWRLEDLPIIPPTYGIKVIDNPGVQKQFQIIKNIIHDDCEYIVNCGDAGQEGELIQRWVLLKAQCKVPVKRLWISSLTAEAISEGFNNLKDSASYDNLYAAGTARAIGDWLLGINATRLFTKQYGVNNTVLSIGRVQTPTLAMIVARQLEIESFTSAVYWELKTNYKEVIFTATIDRLQSEERAQKGLAYLQQHLFEITNYEIKEGKEKCPKLFDLTSLQVEANKKYGYSADQTLKLIQTLYEKKLVTYPRVDTQYLPDDLYPKIPAILQSMKSYNEFIAPLLQAAIPKSKNVFDNAKVTDHHAIIPTSITASQLPEEEDHIYNLVAKRFIAVFYPDAKVSNTVVEGKVGSIPFKAQGKQILEEGWKVLYPKEANKDADAKEENEQLLPHFTQGEQGPHTPFIHQGKTTPPKYFTEATLLRAMETAGKQIDDEDAREAMKENGIGRPSTRAGIIETLFKRKYIDRKKKNIVATPMGIELIGVIENELLKSVELTGSWEKKIRQIEKGTLTLNEFKSALTEMVSGICFEVKYQSRRDVSLDKEKVLIKGTTNKVEESPKAKKASNDSNPLRCPKCKNQNLIKGKAAYGCENYSICGFKIPFMFMNKTLSQKQVSDLAQKGITSTIKDIVDPNNGKLSSGKFGLNEQFEIYFINK